MSTKLTDSQLAMLSAAAGREDRCLVSSPNLKGGAAQKVAAKLVAEGLVKEIKAKAGMPVWRRDGADSQAYALKLTAAGMKMIAADDESEVAPERRETPSPESLAAATSSSDAARAPDVGKAAPREGSKLASVIALLRRSEGATILALTEATGWLPHTTRAAITGVRKRGYSVVRERSEERGSVYRLSDPPTEGAPAIARSGEQAAGPRREPKAKRAA
jgi:hypothetical protein